VQLHQKSIKIAAASRSTTPELAREMLKLLRVTTKPILEQNAKSSNAATVKAIEYFDEVQIYPESKISHFEQIEDATKISYEEMLFFDDESRNREVEQLGVVMWLVKDGVCNDEIDKAVLSWRKRNKRELQ
jgi:magnesium-dependent phosphatase 1